jgi:hypothetical protein
MPVIPVNRAVVPKRIIEKNGGTRKKAKRYLFNGKVFSR